MDVFDKQIHKDDFRLRLLVTDGCNKNCYHCLNDFQPHPADRIRLLNPTKAKRIIRDYCSTVGHKAQVEFSGGEPGIYPYLNHLVSYAKEHGAFVKVNTNGMAFNWGIENFVDCWHIGVTCFDKELAKKVNNVRGQVQIVVTTEILNRIRYTVGQYGLHGIPVKLFVDFFAEGEDKRRIEQEITTIIENYPSFNITTRYTGIQENRGVLCHGCAKKCITLKALWVFPDGNVSPCPQGEVSRRAFDSSSIETARDMHLTSQGGKRNKGTRGVLTAFDRPITPYSLQEQYIDRAKENKEGEVA